MSGKKLTIYAL